MIITNHNNVKLVKLLVNFSSGELQDKTVVDFKGKRDEVIPYYFLNLIEINIIENAKDKAIRFDNFIRGLIKSKIGELEENLFSTYEERKGFELAESLREMNQDIGYSLQIKLDESDCIFNLLKHSYEILTLTVLEGDEERFSIYLDAWKSIKKGIKSGNLLNYSEGDLINLEKVAGDFLKRLIEIREEEYKKHLWKVVVEIQRFNKEYYQVYSDLEYKKAKSIINDLNNIYSQEDSRREFLQSLAGRDLLDILKIDKFSMRRV